MEFLFRKCHQLPVLYTYCCRRAPIIAIVPTPAAIRRESAKEEGAEPFLPQKFKGRALAVTSGEGRGEPAKYE